MKSFNKNMGLDSFLQSRCRHIANYKMAEIFRAYFNKFNRSLPTAILKFLFFVNLSLRYLGI